VTIKASSFERSLENLLKRNLQRIISWELLRSQKASLTLSIKSLEGVRFITAHRSGINQFSLISRGEYKNGTF